MAGKNEIAEFVRTALRDGRSRGEIAKALNDAGWSQSEVDDALGAWSDVSFSTPVPNPGKIVSARDFFVHGLTFAMLLTAAVYLSWVLFDIIDLTVGDDQYPEWTTRSLRWSIAGLIVSGPLYGWLAWREERAEAKDPGRSRSAIRNWLTYLTLLVAACTFLGDLIWTLGSFLNGELTLVSVLRMAVIAAISGGIFLYYRGRTAEAAK
jgi:hypothetical protein